MEIVGGRESQNLRDFLRIKEEDRHNNVNQSSSSTSGGGRHNPSGLTLNAVLSLKRGPPPTADEPLQRAQSNRTLLDIIREDQSSGLGAARRDGRRSWRHLTDKIRLGRRGSAAAAWSSTVAIPSSDVPLTTNNNAMTMMTRRPSFRFNSNTDSGESTQPAISAAGPGLQRNPNRPIEITNGSRIEDTSSSLPRRRLISETSEEEHGGDTIEEEEGPAEQPVRMSLMALLAETDRQMGVEGSAYITDEKEEGEEEEDEIIIGGGATSASGGEYNNCCVCMVRHKGAAFIPCGHTFCRLCSRELWVQRGNCPLCNNYILEILDIF